MASQETELGRYKAKLYRAIGSRWYLYVQKQISLLSVGSVRIRFYVRANGVIDNLQILDGDPRSVLTNISRRSILEVGAMEPFPDQMKEQLGDGYYEEITFSIY
jgi:outer membrane biosynthesis protein TonB